MKNTPYTGYKQRGRLVVLTESDKARVIDFLTQLDEFEQDYMPDDFILVKDTVGHDSKIGTVYMGKYEPNLDQLWKWANEMNVAMSYYFEDQEECNQQFYSTKEETPLERELYNALKNLYDKVTNIRGVDIEEIYAVEECKNAVKAIERFNKSDKK